MKRDGWFVYMVECGDGSLYTGITNDVEARVATHNLGKGAKYTKVRLPVQLVFSEVCVSRSEAAKREWEIKQLKREEKLSLMK